MQQLSAILVLVAVLVLALLACDHEVLGMISPTSSLTFSSENLVDWGDGISSYAWSSLSMKESGGYLKLRIFWWW